LYLDLDYTPEPFNPLTTSRMNATVVMSDGSNYNSQPGGLNRVRFTAGNGQGEFSGGYGDTAGSGTADFRSQTDSTNNTRQVTFTDGSSNTGLDIFLSDTQIKMSAACMRQLRPQPVKEEECTEPPTIVKKENNRYCAEGGNSSSYCWSLDGRGNPLFTNGKNTAVGNCVVLNSPYRNFDLKVEDCNPEFRDFCFDTLEKADTPKIEKRISKNLSPARYTTQVNFSTTGSAQTENIKYKLDYTPSNYEEGQIMKAKIMDPAFTGKITGVKTGIDGSKTSGGTITFDLPKAVSIRGYTLCGPAASQLDKCFSINQAEGSLTIQGIRSTDLITIEYSGTLRSGLTLEDCRTGKYCNEQFKNMSTVTDVWYCTETTDTCTRVDTPKIESNTVLAELVCQYFLTRASGDVFLEDELRYGIDVSKCYPFKNTSSTIVKPTKPIDNRIPKSGTPEIVSLTHEICSAGQKDFQGFNTKLTSEQLTSLKKLFGSEISNLSSQICEIGLVPGSDWDKDSISAAIGQNISKLTRWDDGSFKANNINNISQIANAGGVYYYKGHGDTVTIDGLAIPEGSGALTIIVENADLQINKNIEYIGGTGTDSSSEKISSLGVIVLDGNMFVSPAVEKLAGAYFVQRTEADNYLVGNIFSGSFSNPRQQSNLRLTVNGSIYGNIGPLFEQRVASGDISKDEGAITIRYDQRMIQNPPAGLSELLGTYSQSQIAQ
jgi:hypothetical protein